MSTNNSSFTSTNVVFNPTTYTPTWKWGGAINNNTDMDNVTIEQGYVPVFMNNDWDKGVRNISDTPMSSNPSGTPYHTIENLKKGKGDPCKLVGYKISDIRAMLMNNQLPDNKLYRLPTKAENEAFDNTYKNWDSTKGGTIYGVPNVFLPATDRRSDNGAMDGGSNVGGYACLFWTSTPHVAESSTSSGLYYCNAISLEARNGTHYGKLSVSVSVGYAVRCIPQSFVLVP